MKTSAAIIALAAALAAARNTTLAANPRTEILSCESLTCSPLPEVCAEATDPERGIGIAEEVLSLGVESVDVSLTLIDGLDSPGTPHYALDGYEYSDQQLFIGVSPDEELPEGCLLMFQYQAQTFPFDIDAEYYRRATSCYGIINEMCMQHIGELIQDFDGGEEDRCGALTQHVNGLIYNTTLCPSLIPSFINATGGALPSTSDPAAADSRLGSDCQPMLPESYRMHKVAEMRQYYFISDRAPSDAADFFSPQMGGRGGFTPVVSVLFDDDGDITDDMQWACMRTFEIDGDERPNQFSSADKIGPGKTTLVGVLIASILATCW